MNEWITIRRSKGWMVESVGCLTMTTCEVESSERVIWLSTAKMKKARRVWKGREETVSN